MNSSHAFVRKKNSLIPFRYVLAFLSFTLSVVLYIDRACISTSKASIMESLGISVTQFGWIMASFTLGYALFQTPLGFLADRKGPRLVITSIVSIWSVFTSLTGFAWNYISMLIIRFFFGAGEAGAFPALAKVTYNWFPVKERGLIQGINFSGSRIGAALAMPLVATLIAKLGWRHTFLLLGVVGVIYAIVWYFTFRDNPSESKFVSEKEYNVISQNREVYPEKAVKDSLSPKLLFKSGNLWLAMFQYIASNFSFYFALTWMYPYIHEKFQLNIIEAGFYASVPLLCGAAGNWLSGLLVDGIYRKGRYKLSRRFPAIAGFALAATGMFMVTTTDTVMASVFWMSVAVFGADMTLSPSWSFCIDIGKEFSGTVSGTMNMAGNLGAFVTIIAYPYLFHWTGSNVPFFYSCSGLSILAIFVWLFMNSEKTIVKS